MSARDKSVLVTGGGSGIGLAIARAFANAAYEVKVAGRDEARLKAAQLPYVVMDVTEERSVNDAIARCGDIDIFVANAGEAETAPAVKTPREMWDRMIALNLTSVYTCARVFVPPMIARKWGRFIVIASTAALKGYPYAAAYGAAKHGALGFVRTLALELAQSGITANALCPGYTDTPLVSAAIKSIVQKTGRKPEEALAVMTRNNPMGLLVAPEEVAAASLWLASDAAASVNGQAIAIDGGETAS